MRFLILFLGVWPPSLPSNKHKSRTLLSDFPARLKSQHSLSWKFNRFPTHRTRLSNRKQIKKTQSIRSVLRLWQCQYKIQENQASGTWHFRTNFHFRFCCCLCVQNETLGNNATTFIKEKTCLHLLYSNICCAHVFGVLHMTFS